MELFKVTCVTCQAKLSVRNAALIGEIVACPKCESMVLVAAPESAALTHPPSPDSMVKPASQVTEPVEQPTPNPPDKSTLETEVVDSPPTEIPSPDEVAHLSVDTTSAGNQALLWWIASFAIGASITGAFLALRHQEESEPAVVADSQNLDAAEEITIAAKESPTPSEPAEQQQPAATPNRRSPGMSTHEDPAAEIKAAPPANAQPVETQPPRETGVEETLTPTESRDPQQPSPKLVVEPPDEPRIARKFDPLRFDLEQMDLENLGTNEVSTEATTDLPPQPAFDDDVPKQQPPLEQPAVVRLNENSAEQIATRPADTQLQYKVPSLAVKDMALTDFLALVSSLSGVPISVAPIELQMAGISPGKQVSLDAQEIRLDEALIQVLKPLHLEFTTSGPQVILVREAAQRVRKIDYPIGDLVGTQSTPEDFAKWVEELIAPESWAKAGGSGTITATTNELQVEQAQSIHFRILFFLERIRRAKQIPLRSRYPERLLSAKPYGLQVADRIAAPTTFTFSHETPLAEVFRYWQSEMGLPVFVDWPALAKVNLWPESRITCHITNKPWQAALDAVLAPLELGWRAGPGGTIQITSLAIVNNEPVLDIYPTNLWKDKTNGEATVIHDSANDLVYVRAPAAVQRKVLGR